MDETCTHISWPSRLKIGAKSKKGTTYLIVLLISYSLTQIFVVHSFKHFSFKKCSLQATLYFNTLLVQHVDNISIKAPILKQCS